MKPVIRPMSSQRCRNNSKQRHNAQADSQDARDDINEGRRWREKDEGGEEAEEADERRRVVGGGMPSASSSAENTRPARNFPVVITCLGVAEKFGFGVCLTAS